MRKIRAVRLLTDKRGIYVHNKGVKHHFTLEQSKDAGGFELCTGIERGPSGSILITSDCSLDYLGHTVEIPYHKIDSIHLFDEQETPGEDAGQETDTNKTEAPKKRRRGRPPKSSDG